MNCSVELSTPPEAEYPVSPALGITLGAMEGEANIVWSPPFPPSLALTSRDSPGLDMSSSWHYADLLLFL